MVRPLIFALGASLLIADVAKGQLVLTPTTDEYVLDGAKLKQLAFSDGGKKVTYQSPQRLGLFWHSGTTNALSAEQTSGRSDNHQSSTVEPKPVR